MADLTDFKKHLEAIRAAITERLPEIAEILTISAKGLAERNIKEQGFGALYSENKVPAWFLHGKELNARGAKFLQDHGVNEAGKQGEGKKKRRKKKGDPDPGQFETLVNWGEFRQAQGLQSAFVDASYSNKMWANMAPVKVEERQGGVFVALLGATNKEAQNKMNYNFDRYGDFVRKGLTDESGRILGDLVISELSQTLNKFL